MKKDKIPPVTIKFYEVINWLFSSQIELPEKFIQNSTKLNTIVPYLTEQFWTIPQLTSYLNKHTNNLFNQPDPIKVLELLKKIVRNQHLTKANCWTFIPRRTPDLLKEIQERDELDTGNAKGKIMLMKKLSVTGDGYFKTAPTKKNTNLHDATKKEIVKEALVRNEEKATKIKEEARKNDSRYLQNLTQEVINELGLILFDVSLLKKTNRVLFTFIDSNNFKKYFIVPFTADIYLSGKKGVINNDYIEKKSDDFTHYVINDIKLYTKLKFILNTSYKRLVNVGL